MAAARVLVAYHTSEGQTAKIAARVAEVAESDGADVALYTAEHAPAPSGFDVVVLGDSIHQGNHSRELKRYMNQHGAELAEMPVALFQVSLTSANDDEQHTSTAHEMLQGLIIDTGVDPHVIGLFAGALRYTKYGWAKRHVMQRVAAHDGRDTDMSVDHEYTDWEAVEHFAHDAVALATVDA